MGEGCVVVAAGQVGRLKEMVERMGSVVVLEQSVVVK